jgi:surface antigen
MIKKIALVSVVALSLTACQTAGQKQTGGAILGGIGGAVAGAQFGDGKGQLAAVAAGTLLGAFLGSEIGKSLDRADQAAMTRTTQTSLETQPTGTTSSWSNPDSGNYGTVTPTRTYQQSSGEYCREYQQTVTVGGQTQDAYGTACRQPDGSWKVVN